MAKVTPGQLTTQAAAQNRGRQVYRNTKHGTVVQKWPKARGRSVTPYRFYVENEFAIAATWACEPSAIDRETAENLTSGSLYIWRDALVAASYGRFLRIINPDGSEMNPVRDVSPNPQLVLDLLGDLPGSMIVRTSIGWEILPPGDSGQFLGSAGGGPQWQDPVGGDSGGVVLFPQAHLAPASATTQSANYVQGTMAVINPGDRPNAVQFFATAAAATSQNTPRVHINNGNQGGALVQGGSTITGVVAGINTLLLDGEIDVSVPTFLFVGIHTKVASFSTPTAAGCPDWYVFASGSPPDPLGTVTQGSNTALTHCWLARV